MTKWYRAQDGSSVNDSGGPEIPPLCTSSLWISVWKGKMLGINPSDQPASLGPTAAG